jgi:putative flippase GtrA
MWRTLGRHQVGAVVASVVDFGTMIFCVETLRMSPVAATGIGATVGGATNFALGRLWIFRPRSGALSAQAARYALVAAASACWNALGEYLVHDRAHVGYVVARLLVAVVVGLLWNFTVQRSFVFGERRAA